MPLSRKLTNVCAALLLLILTGSCGGARRLDVKPSDPSILYVRLLPCKDNNFRTHNGI